MAMDIVDRVRRMRNSLGEVLTNLKTSMSIKSPSEINRSDDLGAEPEPDPEDILSGLGSEEQLGETPAPETPEGEPDVDVDSLLAADTPPSAEEPKEDEEKPQEDTLGAEPEVAEVEKPKERVWEPVESPDGKGLRFKSDKEGVQLDMKMMNIDPFVWLARLQRDNKLLDWGTVLIPKDTDDPVQYIKFIANAMLDTKSLRYEQEWQMKFAEARKKEEEKEEAPPEPENILGELGGAPEAPAPEEAIPPEAAPPEAGEEIDIDSLLA